VSNADNPPSSCAVAAFVLKYLDMLLIYTMAPGLYLSCVCQTRSHNLGNRTLASSRPSVCPSVWNNLAHTRRIFMKFDT